MAKRGGFPRRNAGEHGKFNEAGAKMQRQMEEQAKEMEDKRIYSTAGGGAVRSHIRIQKRKSKTG